MSVIIISVTNDLDIHFEVLTPLGFSVRVTRSYWELIVTIKHPVMVGRESDVQETLQNPDEIRISRNDSAVHLFYRRSVLNDGYVPLLSVLMERAF